MVEFDFVILYLIKFKVIIDLTKGRIYQNSISFFVKIIIMIFVVSHKLVCYS